MPPDSGFNQKLFVISRRPPAELSKGANKLSHVEKYLARQARNVHMLGVHDLEVFYNVGFLALRLWRMEGQP